MLTDSNPENQWDYVDSAMNDGRVLRLSSMEFVGDEMISELEASPLIDFGTFAIDFNDDTWYFDVGLSPVVNKAKLTIRFSGTNRQVWKLYMLYRIVERSCKTHTCIDSVEMAMRAFKGCGGTDPRWTMLYIDQYLPYIDSISHYSAGHQMKFIAGLLLFLEFRDTFFRVPNDPDLNNKMVHDRKSLARTLWHSEGTPAIDDAYLIPLVSACRRALDDESVDHRMGIGAATTLLATQLGWRISEIRAMEVGALEVFKLDGRSDVGLIRCDTFKTAKGDGGRKAIRSRLNPLSLQAYLWLEEHCRPDRERLGTKSLIVTPQQRNDTCSGHVLNTITWSFMLANHDTIPCLGTQDRFPEMGSGKLNGKSLGRRLGATAKRLGLTCNETFVYPRFHSYRSTVATELSEEGFDPEFIRLYMNHLDVDTTIGYIRSDREIEKAHSELTYRTVLVDGAEMIGPHAKAFQRELEDFVAELPEQVKANVDEVVALVSKTFPLRRKVGGICIRCGSEDPSCKINDETDMIYCAFGVCPNRNELRKAQNVIRDALMPELESLDRQLAKIGRDGVLSRFPQLEELIDTLDEVREEVAGWQAMSI